MSINFNKKGFTLIEISLVMVLISILIGITTPLVSNVIIRAELNSAHESLYNAILRAQQLSKTQYRDQQWRVCINNTNKTYTIAAGTCSSTLYPEIITISSNIEISSLQTLDLQFTSTKGELNYTGNFSKITLSSGGVSKSIIINRSGVIDKAATSDPSNTTSTPTIVTNGLVLNLDAGNIASYPGTGTTWTDLSGNGNNGTLVNGVGYNTGNLGNLVFNGSNNYITTSINNLNLNELSICVWVKFNSISNTQYPTITNKETSNLNRNWWLGLSPKIVFGRSVSGQDKGVVSSITPNLNQWYYIVATNNTTPTFNIYINGILDVTANFSGTLSTAGSANWIGTYRDLIYPMNGNISNISYYNRSLSSEEIQQNFNATKARFGL